MTGKGLKRTDIGLLLLRYTYISSTKTKYFISSAYRSLSRPLFNVDSISRVLCLFYLYSSNRAFTTKRRATCKKSCHGVHSFTGRPSGLRTLIKKSTDCFHALFQQFSNYIQKSTSTESSDLKYTIFSTAEMDLICSKI